MKRSVRLALAGRLPPGVLDHGLLSREAGFLAIRDIALGFPDPSEANGVPQLGLVVEPVIAILSSPDESPEVITAAARCIFELARFPASKRAIGLLAEQLVKSSQEIVKPKGADEVWVEGLARFGGSAIPRIRPLLKHAAYAVRRNAARVLGRMGPEVREAIPDLAGMLASDREAGPEAVTALGQIGREARAAVPALLDLALSLAESEKQRSHERLRIPGRIGFGPGDEPRTSELDDVIAKSVVAIGPDAIPVIEDRLLCKTPWWAGRSALCSSRSSVARPVRVLPRLTRLFDQLQYTEKEYGNVQTLRGVMSGRMRIEAFDQFLKEMPPDMVERVEAADAVDDALTSIGLDVLDPISRRLSEGQGEARERGVRIVQRILERPNPPADPTVARRILAHAAGGGPP